MSFNLKKIVVMNSCKKILFLSFAFFFTLLSNAQDAAMHSFASANNIVYGEAEKTIETPLLENKQFTYKYQGKKVLVSFSDTEHVEYFNDKKYFIKSTISWISAYECSMELQESNLPNFPFKKGTKLTMEITKVKRGYIYYTSTLAGKTWTGKMREI
jgi:hypothetical protein